jgi:hypothetical protein
LKPEHDAPLSNFAFNFNLRRYILVAPAVFVGEKPSAEPAAKPSGGGFTPPLDRALRFAWLRFLISQDATGLNYVRGSVGRQIAAIEVEPYTGSFSSSA